MEDLTKLTKLIQEVQHDFNINLEAALLGNKSAAQRARKNTLTLEVLYKKYRKDSVAALK